MNLNNFNLKLQFEIFPFEACQSSYRITHNTIFNPNKVLLFFIEYVPGYSHRLLSRGIFCLQNFIPDLQPDPPPFTPPRPPSTDPKLSSHDSFKLRI